MTHHQAVDLHLVLLDKTEEGLVESDGEWSWEVRPFAHQQLQISEHAHAHTVLALNSRKRKFHFRDGRPTSVTKSCYNHGIILIWRRKF